MLSRLLAASSSFRFLRALPVRFCGCDSRVYFCPLMKLTLLALEARVLGLADLIERLAEVFHDVELVEQDGGLRRVSCAWSCETPSTCP